jgi:hypothetical protein
MANARNELVIPMASSPRLGVAGELNNCVDDGAGRTSEDVRNKAEVHAQLAAGSDKQLRADLALQLAFDMNVVLTAAFA